MDSQPPLRASDYCYMGSSDPEVDQLFRRVCALAWPYALFCATRYYRDSHVAYDLLREAIENAERYYERYNHQRSSGQLYFRVLSVIKRLSKQKLARIKETAHGNLSDLELLAEQYSQKSDIEQTIFVQEILSKMSERSRQITLWRLAGHSWRKIAEELNVDHVTLRRVYQKEIRGLLSPSSDSHPVDLSEESD